MVVEIASNENKVMRLLREVKGYTQEYVGSYLGIEQNTYSKLEKGQTRLTVDRIKKLSELYNVHPDYFLTDEVQIVNNNSGEGSKSYTKNTFNSENYNETDVTLIKAMYERMIEEKDAQIELLRQEMAATRLQLNELFTKLAGKL